MNDLHDYQNLIEQAPDAVIFADVKGNIRMWNNKAVEIFGHEVTEALGQSLDIIIPEKLRKPHWEGFFHAIKKGEIKYAGKILTTKSFRKDGDVIYVNLTFSIIKGETGYVTGVMAIARDFTEQYLKEKALKVRTSLSAT